MRVSEDVLLGYIDENDGTRVDCLCYLNSHYNSYNDSLRLTPDVRLKSDSRHEGKCRCRYE